MAAFEDVVIISACRTAVGKFQGSLSDLSAPQLGAVAWLVANTSSNAHQLIEERAVYPGGNPIRPR